MQKRAQMAEESGGRVWARPISRSMPSDSESDALSHWRELRARHTGASPYLAVACRRCRSKANEHHREQSPAAAIRSLGCASARGRRRRAAEIASGRGGLATGTVFDVDYAPIKASFVTLRL
jgi:hypothetical protein